MKSNKLFFALAVVSSIAFAGDGDRKFIREGMSDSEVLMKIGKPDADSELSGGGAKVAVRKWTYFPTSGDPNTITVVTIQGGQVVKVERTISR